MNIQIFLLRLVQTTAIITFAISTLFIFIPRFIKNKKAIRSSFFKNKKVFEKTSILTLFYLFLFPYLFFSHNYSVIPIYIIGVVLALGGLIIAQIARTQLRKTWGPLTNIHNPKQIIQKGLFSIIRHPVYSGRLIFFLGVMLMLNLWGISVALLYWYYLRDQIIEEETYLKKENPKYEKYMKKVSRGIF